jgi:hypothetical protein
VNVQDARVVGNAGKRFVKCRNRGRKIGGPSPEAARADERNAKLQRMPGIHDSLLKL